MDDVNVIKKNPDLTGKTIKIKTKNSGKGMRKIVFILILLVVILGGTSFYFYKNGQLAKDDPNSLAQGEAKNLAKKVGKLVILPESEIPTVATVSDPEALKGQAFFADAKKGDKVLIYTKAQKAVLYDPSVNKIVTVAPLNISSDKVPTPDNSTIPKPITEPAASSVKKNQF